VAAALKSRCAGIDLGKASLLEIGCGTGYYTGLMREWGVKKYVGVDITDVLFDRLEAEFPEYKFRKTDITSEKIMGNYDLILMIDVVIHIVTEAKLARAMENVKECLKKDGILILSPVFEKGEKLLFYNRTWSLDEISSCFPGYEMRKEKVLEYSMVSIRRK